MTNRIQWKPTIGGGDLPVARYEASGQGWTAVVERASGAGWTAAIVFRSGPLWTFPEYHEGITGKSERSCKAWVRRTITG